MQFTSITSEALQAAIRRLLPSQQGFGEDLQASNVITPIIDLTPTAEGSQIGVNLQTAWDFSTGQITVASTTLTNVVSNSGFWKVALNVANPVAAASVTWPDVDVLIDDGTSTKVIWKQTPTTSAGGSSFENLSTEFVVFLRAGDTLKARTAGSTYPMEIWYRQIADVNGNLVTPSGFTPQ